MSDQTNRDPEPETEPAGEPSKTDASPVGQTSDRSEPALVWCRKCEADVRPAGKGACPRCGSFLKLNYASRRHPVNVLRRDQLLAEILVKYPASDALERFDREQLAAAMERLENTRPESPDWQRLMTAKAQLEQAAESTRHAQSTDVSDLSGTDLSQLISRTEELLNGLYRLDGRPVATLRQPLHVDDAVTVTEPDTTPIDTAGPLRVATFPETEIAPTVEPAPQPICPYCHRPCVGPDHVAFTTFHHDDPIQKQKRDALATKIMLRQMPFGHPY
jgi:hypothetical protein